MSRERLADAMEEQAALYARLAEVTAQVAHELRGADTPQASASPATVAAGVIESAPVGNCPKHGKPFEQGQFGGYCKSRTDDPAWGKAKTDRDGNPVLWCSITPKNASKWLEIHGMAAA
jgi:hypothetical protein